MGLSRKSEEKVDKVDKAHKADKVRKINFFVLTLSALSALSTLSTYSFADRPAIFSKLEALESTIERATFRFREDFVLVPTNEHESITGRVYMDKKSNKTRVDYGGRVKAKVWLENNTIFFYDDDLKQLIIRPWEDFLNYHMQAFLDIPILWNVKDFEQQFNLTEVKSSTPAVTQILARPKREAPYHVVLSFDSDTGQPKGLSLRMENYRADVEIEDFNTKAKFRDKIFERQLPRDVAILDMRETGKKHDH